MAYLFSSPVVLFIVNLTIFEKRHVFIRSDCVTLFCHNELMVGVDAEDRDSNHDY